MIGTKVVIAGVICLAITAVTAKYTPKELTGYFGFTSVGIFWTGMVLCIWGI